VSRLVGRAIGLDVHRDFCEVAICEAGAVRSAGRIETSPEALELFAESLGPDDRVALEVTGAAWEIAGILESHVRRVVVVSPDDTGIRQARAKTDRLDARTLARLLWAGELDAVWMPDERCRVMRRRLARREQLVRARTRAKNEIHAVLMRRLKGRPPVSDLFGVKGRRWLRALELPVEEAETLESALRQIEFLDAEIAAVERLIAREALDSADARRLMTVPGVNVICAATFVAAVGDIRRFGSARALVAYLGLDPRVRQSGTEPARSGRISKRGSTSARWALVEAAASVVRQPGPLHAFYERLRARRGHGKAVVAAARKLATPAHARRGLRPPATVADRQEAAARRDHRRRPDAAGQAHRRLGHARADAPRRARARQAGRGLLHANGLGLAGSQTGASHRRQPGAGGRERDTGARTKALEGATSRGRPRAPDACASTRHRLAPTRSLTAHRCPPTRRHADRARPKTGRIAASYHRAAETEATEADLTPPRPTRDRSDPRNRARNRVQGPLTFFGRPTQQPRQCGRARTRPKSEHCSSRFSLIPSERTSRRDQLQSLPRHAAVLAGRDAAMS
jgi:transposase